MVEPSDLCMHWVLNGSNLYVKEGHQVNSHLHAQFHPNTVWDTSQSHPLWQRTSSRQRVCIRMSRERNSSRVHSPTHTRAERSCRTFWGLIVWKGRSMRIEACLPEFLWNEAVMASTQILTGLRVNVLHGSHRLRCFIPYVSMNFINTVYPKRGWWPLIMLKTMENAMVKHCLMD